jgi:hypothetical protein
MRWVKNVAGVGHWSRTTALEFCLLYTVILCHLVFDVFPFLLYQLAISKT